jgi:TonB-dependent starch-binding outer membrane protein SusC
MPCLSRVPGWQFVRRRAMTLISAALALPVVATIAAAQTGTIVGTVSDAASKAPVPSVQVQIVGSSRGVISGADGKFRMLVVPSGPVQLRVTRIGYAAAMLAVTVPSGDMVTADFVLTPTQVQLDQVVVTGTLTNERERETGNLVATIATDSISKAPVETFSDLIAGKAAGVSVDQQSGEAGTSSRIRIRGNNSISLPNDPLLIIDGVWADNNPASTTIGVGGQVPSRFDDLNPDDIANVEILKGPSASALYGTAGANGVILVTTKKGVVGHSLWSAHADYGGVYQAGVFPANFGQAGTLAPALGGGPTTQCTLLLQGTGGCTAAKDSLLQWNPIMSSTNSPFSKGNIRDAFGGSVAGGSDATRYFASGDYDFNHGVYVNNFQQKNNGRVNLQANPAPTVDFSLNAGYLQSRLSLPQNDNNDASPLVGGALGSPIDDPVMHGYNAGLFTPQQDAQFEVTQSLERFTGGATSNWRPFGWLTLTGVGGIDVSSRNDFQLFPVGVATKLSALLGTGDAVSDPFETTVYTAQFNAAAQYNLSSSIHGTSSAGTQYTNNITRGTFASGFGLIPGTASLGGATDQFAASQLGNDQVVDVGYYAQQQFGWRDKVFISGALRLDDNSSFGQVYTPSFYPSVSGSWVIGEEPWFPKGAVLSSLRLRTAYGFSGQHPGFQQAQTFYNGITAFIPGVGEEPAVTLGNIGNGSLKPERSGEFEGGFDAGFWHDRLNFQATGYSKSTTNALVAVNLAPSIGGVNFTEGNSLAGLSTRFENLGQVDNRGLEMSLTANLIRSQSTRLDVTINQSYNVNKVITLGPNIAPIFFDGPIGTNTQVIKAGLPLGAWFQPSYSYADKNHDGIIETNEVNDDSTNSFQGNRDPAQFLSFNPQLTVFKYFKISTLFDRQSDVVVYNVSELLRCVDIENCQWNYDPHSSLQDQAKVAAFFAKGGTQTGFLEDGSFWKWRELSLRATAPDAWVRHLRVSSLSFTIAGRNLRTWTKYTGVDPETNAAPGLTGAAAFAQQEFATQPLVRFWTGRFDISF